MKLRKKLIEVALPLEAINKASAREKSIRHGHPSTLHLWWARRPLAAARAVIFSQMVDDPSEYVDTLKSDPKLLKRAESELKKRHKVWGEATAELARAEAAGISAPPPGPEPTLDEIIAEQERDRLFRIIEDLVLWENTTNETVLEKARAEIWQSWRRTCADNADHPRAKELFDRNKLPAFHDPFAGGGALPLEAQRLGLEAYASDLNPVAVLINKAMIEIPPKFAGMPPVNPEWQSKSEGEKAMRTWRGAEGLAEDVRYYGKWMRDEAEKRIGHLYPKVEVTDEMAKGRRDLKPYVGKKLTAIAWIWARTVKSPNPALRDIDVPLVSTFELSTKKGSEVRLEPVIENHNYHFIVKTVPSNDPEITKHGTKLARGANFQCLMSGVPISGEYIKAEGKAGRMGARLIAVVAKSQGGRIYLPSNPEMEKIAKNVLPVWKPEVSISGSTQYLGVKPYGIDRFDQLFLNRQLQALSTLADAVSETRGRVLEDAESSALSSQDDKSLESGGTGNVAYADAVSIYLGMGVSKLSDYNASLVQWSKSRDQAVHVFGRQALPMVWDFAEINPFADAAGDLTTSLAGICRTIEICGVSGLGVAEMNDAQNQRLSLNRCVSTDPPYYDNVPYADLSDYFYVWLRRALKPILKGLFTTVTVPKTEELVAFAYRHDGKRGAEKFFLDGMTEAMKRIADQAHIAFPVTIYYAFKQVEEDDSAGSASTGWETFLDAVIRAGFAIGGTWPMRTEKPGRMRENASNALASSIILVCRRRTTTVQTVTRREFVNALKSELPEALRHLQRGNIAPVDLAQAAIGPGMAVYTRYEKVLDAEGKPLRVRDALALINQTLDEVLAEQEGDFDADTRFALTWFDQFGFAVDKSGVAEVLATAKATSVHGVADAGIAETGGGNFRLLKPDELPKDWTPESDKRLTVWDMVHHLIRVLEKDGEAAAAQIAAKLGVRAETARELCYRLYSLCERKKRASEALSYNGLVQSWPEIMRLARESSATGTTQTELFD
jgi:putative DNA methylase